VVQRQTSRLLLSLLLCLLLLDLLRSLLLHRLCGSLLLWCMHLLLMLLLLLLLLWPCAHCRLFHRIAQCTSRRGR
jgi:hypothetical protein